jgi:hypothetical protein
VFDGIVEGFENQLSTESSRRLASSLAKHAMKRNILILFRWFERLQLYHAGQKCKRSRMIER